MFIDLDKFKHVNDALGHTMGDELLRQVSSRLVGSVRLGDIIGRLGGDEFAALIEDVSSPGEAEQIASKLIHVLSRRFNLGKKAVSISCSIGISFYPLHGHESQSLLMKADLAMYAAKNDGRNNFKTYAPYMDDANPSVSPALDLHEALARNQLVLYYQPLFDSDKGRVTSMEALIRWNHPTMGLLLPFQFIPEAEKSDYIIAIGKWALKKACEQIKVCHNAGFKVRVAVNVSSKQLRQPSFATYVCDLLDKNQLTPNFLQLELNESVVSQYDARSLNNLMELKRYGVHIMVDDFGTSYSSLSYLRSLPIDGLKIDKSFTQDAPTDKAAASIIDALLALAKGLKLEVTAQGVERADQVAFLAGHGCTQIQGYAVSEPLPAEELMQFLTSHPM
jgi:diguanylate cyclase (GGDEF)-like protein